MTDRDRILTLVCELENLLAALVEDMRDDDTRHELTVAIDMLMTYVESKLGIIKC